VNGRRARDEGKIIIIKILIALTLDPSPTSGRGEIC